MRGFTHITFSDMDYIREFKLAAAYLAGEKTGKIDKDRFVVVMISQYLLVRALKEPYVGHNVLLGRLGRVAQHISSCLQVLQCDSRPPPTPHDLQAIINLHTKEIDFQDKDPA